MECRDVIMKRIIMLFLFTLGLSSALYGCSSSGNDKPKKFLGDYEDAYVRVEAEASWNREKDQYEVQVDIHNQSDHLIQLVYECGELIRYKGKPEQTECVNVYSKGLQSKQSKATTTYISTSQRNLSNDIMLIKIVYELDVGKGRTIVGIPLTSTN